MDENTIKKEIEESIRIVRDIDPAYRNQAFGEVLRFLLSSANIKIPSAPLTSDIHSEVAPDPIKFLKDRNILSHSDRVLAMAYFFDKFEGQGSFTVYEMKKMFERCRVVEPSNLSDIISKQAKRGFLRVNEIEGTRFYVLTLEGLEYIENIPQWSH